MYPISATALEALNNNAKQTVEITCVGLEGTITLTDSDIMQGGLTIDRYCVSGDRIEVGSAIASELTLTLRNHDGKFDDYIFEGAEMYVRIGVKKPDAELWENSVIEYIPCGYFTVDAPPRKLSQIKLTALDRMVKFDRIADVEELLPTTIEDLTARICTICGVSLGTDVMGMLNSTYIIDTLPNLDQTMYRQLIMQICELTGTCAYIDWEGKLRLEWYEATPTKITPSERYSSDLFENPIQITGVRIEDADGGSYMYGQEGYVLNIEGNQLLQESFLLFDLAEDIYSVVGGLAYLPYDCTIKPSPHIYPLDLIEYVDKKGTSHTTIVTNVTYKINGRTKLSAKGETAVSAGYATLNPLTKREATIIEQVKRQTFKEIESRQQAVLDLNEMIANSIGLRKTTMTQGDGSIVYYYHDKATLADSTIIYTFGSGGFAWTDEWDGSETIWKYGFTQDGNAVFNALSAYKVQAEYIDATNLEVDAANITGKLVASQINADGIEAEDATINGTISAISGNIGNWIIEAGTVRSLGGVKGDYTYSIYGTSSNTITGYLFTVLTETGIRYVIKEGSNYTSDTLADVSSLAHFTVSGNGGGVV